LTNIGNFAPIVLFVYNRPSHTEQTLIALNKNELSNQSTLYIYCDGPKSSASIDELDKIASVRDLVRKKRWCGEVIINESIENKGLANSIISGVTEIINRHGKIIVLEDDIVPEIGFLKYMNEALDLYENESKVGCIHAWNYNMTVFPKKLTTFFLRGADCWGWGTWKRSWDLFEPDTTHLIAEINRLNCSYNFDRNGTIDFSAMLQDHIDGKIDSWAVRWHASLFLKDKYCLHPVKPIVKNIGLDGTGTHCMGNVEVQEPINSIELVKIPILENEKFFEHFKKSNKKIYSKLLNYFISRF
jgi:hypothetical protein